MAGQPIHPALVHFPFGLLFSSVLVDLAHWAGLWPDTRFAAWLMAGGLATALLAMAAGLYDFRRLTDAQVPHALQHTAAMGCAATGSAQNKWNAPPANRATPTTATAAWISTTAFGPGTLRT
jgi:uncharacterized membrane protein